VLLSDFIARLIRARFLTPHAQELVTKPLVNNAAEQHPQKSLADISRDQLERTFRTNIFSMFYMTKAAVPHLKAGARIVNSASVTAYRGSTHLIDYAATKGAIVAFTRSLSLALVDNGIYVNAVAPGPIWTPLIPASFSEEAWFGGKAPMSRPGQPAANSPPGAAPTPVASPANRPISSREYPAAIRSCVAL